MHSFILKLTLSSSCDRSDLMSVNIKSVEYFSWTWLAEMPKGYDVEMKWFISREKDIRVCLEGKIKWGGLEW